MKSKKLIISGILAQKLSRLHKPPQALFGKGELEINTLLDRPCVGVVGTRMPTAYGVSVTNDIVSELARHRVTIISGLALGIDGLSHKACIDSGGQTIGVLPSSVDNVYPKSHLNLSKRVSEQGILISEYSEGGTPRADQFIARNRIIAALCDVLIIPEAAERSGSLHTANFAIEMGIPVMAIPGNITSRFSSGTNKLIATGATPLLSIEDILMELGIDSKKADDYVPENEAEAKLLGAMHAGLQDGTEIREKSELEPQIFLQTLTMLEIKGIISPLGGDQWRQL